jgi:peptidoglycan/LPS O-acetylase OafA/YrhL
LSLPGVFVNNAFGTAVNGSLWTLGPEFECYALVLILWGSRLLQRRHIVLILFFALFVVSVIAWPLYNRFVGNTLPLPHLGGVITRLDNSWLYLCFLSGMVFYLYRDRIELQRRIVILGWVLLIPVLLTGIGLMAWLVTVGTYSVFHAASSEGSPFNRFSEKIGDLSYGIYIYAFPVQQCIVQIAGGAMNNYANFVVACITTLPLAYLSWHLVEKRALKLRNIKLLKLLTAKA